MSRKDALFHFWGDNTGVSPHSVSRGRMRLLTDLLWRQQESRARRNEEDTDVKNRLLDSVEEGENGMT